MRGTAEAGGGSTIDYVKLSPLDAPAYAFFTYPRLRQSLAQLSPSGPSLALGASEDAEPVGLLLAFLDEAAALGTLVSLFVLPERRHRGIWSELLRRAEGALRERGCLSADAQYTSGRPEIAFFERILAESGWSRPATTMLSCKASSAILEAPFFRRCRLPPGFEIFPWTELTEGERAQLARSQAERAWIPDELDPLERDADCEPLVSVGLRWGGEVVGWVIAHNRLPLAMRYTCAYVRRELQGRCVFIPLLEEAVRRQTRHFPGTPGTWTVVLRDDSMARFVRRRMAPYMMSVNEVRHSSKELG